MTTLEGSEGGASGLGGRFSSLGWFAPLMVILALVSALLTFLILMGLTPVVPTHEVVIGLLAGNAFAVAVLSTMVGRRSGASRGRGRGAERRRGCMCASSACSPSWPRCRRSSWPSSRA